MTKTKDNATKEHVLGGFIAEADERVYLQAFQAAFLGYIGCYRGSDNLIRYFNRDHNKKVSKATQNRIEWWHIGYRDALTRLRSMDY